MVEELLSGARDLLQNTKSDVISDVVHTQTLREFYSPVNLRCPAEITVASCQKTSQKKKVSKTIKRK